MNNFASIELFEEYDYVTYYTIRLVGDDSKDVLSETDKFYATHDKEDHSHFDEFDAIVRVIDAMGNYYRGAEPCFFRFENAADALPPNRKEAGRVFEIEIVRDSELRLYCIRLSNEIVVLLNGGVKTNDDPRKCSNVARHFSFAQLIAKAIDEFILEGAIKLDGKSIINNTGESEIILMY